MDLYQSINNKLIKINMFKIYVFLQIIHILNQKTSIVLLKNKCY